MFINFIGVNEKIINLNAVALIEDRSEEDKSIAVVTTIDGIEIELTDEDADILFQRAELLLSATDKFLNQLLGATQ